MLVFVQENNSQNFIKWHLKPKLVLQITIVGAENNSKKGVNASTHKHLGFDYLFLNNTQSKAKHDFYDVFQIQTQHHVAVLHFIIRSASLKSQPCYRATSV